MSYFLTEMRCKKCGALINVPGGVVGTQNMAPPSEDVKCPNDACGGVGYANFEPATPFPFVGPKKLTDEELYEMDKWARRVLIYEPGRGDPVLRRLNELEKRVEKLERDNNARGVSGMMIK